MPKQPTHSNEYNIVSSYKLGYRNREDVTNLPPGVLIVGSQNVQTNVSERIQIRKGYVVDGAESSVNAAIMSSFDWITRNNGEKHLRAGFLTSAGNDGKLQYRYVDSNGAVSWRDLMTAQTSVALNFCTYWNILENSHGGVAQGMREALFVNGSSNIYRWNGAVTTMASATVNTITKNGTDSWRDEGFYNVANKQIVINGTTYTYTGGETTTTLTGVTPDPSGEAANSVVHQAVVTTANSAMTDIAAAFPNGLIANLNNQIYVGALTSSVVYISNVNSYTDYSSSTPRQTGEGSLLVLDDNIVAFMPQENYMYVSAGQDRWYNVSFQMQTSTVGVTYEQVSALPLKTGRQQGAQSQAMVSHMKNNIITVTNEPTIDLIGRMENYFGTPQTKNISDPIKLDMDSYDFTDGSIFYFQFYIYVAIPKDGVVLMYNIATGSWEAPQTLPISRFYIVDGELYGHSYNSSESYKLFTGYADRVYTGFSGYPIDAKVVFSYQNYGSRFIFKRATSLYTEGYISPNTTILATVTYELDGCKKVKTFTINGSDAQIVCLPSSQAALGKTSLGKQKLGGDSTPSIQGLPPKFRSEKTFSNTDFFEVSISYEILGVDQRFELLAFGLNAAESTQIPVQIRQ